MALGALPSGAGRHRFDLGCTSMTGRDLTAGAHRPGQRSGVMRQRRASRRPASTRSAGRRHFATASSLDERGLACRGGDLKTAKNGTEVPANIRLDERAFWRVVGLYLAEGHATRERRHRIMWSFHPTREDHLIDEVAAYWLRHRVEPSDLRPGDDREIRVQSRVLLRVVDQMHGPGPHVLRAALAQPHLGPSGSRQVGALVRPLRRRRVVVADKRWSQRDHRTGHRQRRARRRRHAPAGRAGNRGLASTGARSEIDEGHALDPDSRRRAGRARHRACARTRPGRSARFHRAPAEANPADRVSPLPRRACLSSRRRRDRA